MGILNTITTIATVGILGYFAYKVILPGLQSGQFGLGFGLPAAAPVPPPMMTQPQPEQEQQQEEEEPSGSGGRKGSGKQRSGGKTSKTTTKTKTPTGPSVSSAPSAPTGPLGKGVTPEALGLKATGQKVAMQKGSAHRNGQRYNVNHKFLNYVMIGIFKTGKGQQVIEMKTDGPNHGSCTSLPKCCWIEPDLKMDGSAHLGAEFPHPTNHNDRPCPSCTSAGTSLAGKEIGFAVGAWQTGEFRTVAMWVDPTGTANSWKRLLQETDKGQITTPELAKRKLFLTGAGQEAEIRMHGATSGDTSMRDCNVFEIVPPGGAAGAAYGYARNYNYSYYGYGTNNGGRGFRQFNPPAMPRRLYNNSRIDFDRSTCY